MTLEEFEKFCLTKSIGRTSIPQGESLEDRVLTALKKIAKDTIPLKLVEHNSLGIKVLRKIDDETYIRVPKRPISNSGNRLDIDDELIDALALYVMAGLETQRAKVLMGMYREEIEQNNHRLIETEMLDAHNDADRYHVFP